MNNSPRAILKLIRGGESEILEFKKSTGESKEAVISVAAILNKHQGGELYFGIKNDGAVTGQTVSGQTLRDISRILAEHIEPRIYPRVDRIQLTGKDCIRVRFTGTDAPYLAYGRAYIRVSDEDRQLSTKELERMFLARSKEASGWETESSNKKVADVSSSVLRTFMRKANAAGRIDFRFGGVRATLNKLGLLRDGRLLKAGQVLFCRDNPMEVQAAIFAGANKTTFLDIKQFKGNVFDLLDKSETYLKEHLDWRVKFGGLERQEIPELPIDALREALVNSLCHRDYRNPKGNEVAVFKDRVEIYNPGDFPEGYRPEDFISGKERSILRNPRIAEALFQSKDIERWGSGLKRISDECAKNGVCVEFTVLKSGFLVTFKREFAKDLSPNARGETRGKTWEKILALIKATPGVTINELARSIGVSAKGIEWNIQKLKAQGRLKRVGSRKSGRWEVVK